MQKFVLYCLADEANDAGVCWPSVAAIMSVVESCKRMGINVRTYLNDVLPQLAVALPDKVADLAATLTPAKWLAARTPAAPAAEPAPGENPT